jgi:MFS family permease
MKEDVSFSYLALAMVLLGLGVGLGTGAAMTAAVEAAPRAFAGVAAGTLSMMRYFGSIVGTSLLGSILSEQATPSAGIFQALFAFLVVVAVLGAATAAGIHRFPEPEPEPAPRQAAVT